MPPKKTATENGAPATTAAGATSTKKAANSRNNVSNKIEKAPKIPRQDNSTVKSCEKTGRDQLTAKQQRFVDEYLVDLNATQAAIRAGYSAKTANVIGPENLSKPCIAKQIQESRNKTAAKLEVTRERVLAELAKMAFVDPRQFYDDAGGLKRITDLDEGTAAALAGFEVDEIKLDSDGPVIGMTKKVKWADKRAALESINRMMGWNQDKLKLQGDAEEPIQAVVTRMVIVPAKEKAIVEHGAIKKKDED